MDKLLVVLLPVLAILAIVGGFGVLLVTMGGILLDLFGVEGVYVLAALIILVALARVGVWLWKAYGLARAAVQAAQVRAQFIAPDEQGLLPIHAGLLMQPQFGAASMSVHAANRGGGKATAELLLRQPEAVALPVATAQSFAQLYQDRKLPGDGFLMGYSLEDGQPITAGWRDLYSALIGGQSGSGKSTLIRSILTQSAMQGGKFVVLDKHFGAGEESLGESLQPLRHLMLCDVAANERQMVDALAYVRSIGEQRLSGKSSDKSPIVLVVDETTALLQRSQVAPLLTDVLGEISQETRKVGVFALCIGQQFNGTVMDTTVRNSFVSFLGCRMRKDVARVMSGNNEFGKMAQDLTIGQAVWMTPGGEMHRLAVPNCTAHDLDLVASQIPASNTRPEAKRALPLVSSGSNSGSVSGSISGSNDDNNTAIGNLSGTSAGTTTEPRSKRVRQLLHEGKTMSQIVRDVWGVEGKGRAYQDAVNEFYVVLRQLTGGG